MRAEILYRHVPIHGNTFQISVGLISKKACKKDWAACLLLWAMVAPWVLLFAKILHKITCPVEANGIDNVYIFWYIPCIFILVRNTFP